MKKGLFAALCLLVCCALCACEGFDLASLGGGNVEELLRAPRTSERQSAVQTALNDYLGETLQLKYPRGGSEPNPVIFADLDGDGAEEAAVLYTAQSKGQNVHLSVLEQSGETWSVAYEVMGLSTEVAEVALAEVFPGSTQLLVGFANAGLTDKFLELYDYRDVTIYSACRQPYDAYWLGEQDGRVRLAAANVSQQAGVSSLQLFEADPDSGSRVMTPMQAVELSAQFERCTGLWHSLDGEYECFVVDGLSAQGMVSQFVRFTEGELSLCLDRETGEPLCHQRPRALAALTPRVLGNTGEMVCASAGESIPTLRSTERFYPVDWMDDLRAESLRAHGVWDARYGVFIRMPEAWHDAMALTEQPDGSWQVRRREDSALLCTVALAPPGEGPEGAVDAASVGENRLYITFGDACPPGQQTFILSGIF